MKKDNSKQEYITRVAIYARVSTQEQAEQGYSIDAQLEMLNNYCKENNKVCFKEYVDRGISGKSIEGRYQLQQMLLDAKAGLFDEVIVWKINRLARKQLDLLKIVEELNKYSVTFRSYSENFETETPMGRFALQMMGSVAELERNTIVDNVRMGMRQKAKEGKWNGGIVLGYRSVSIGDETSKNKERGLEVVPEEALIVKKIYTMYSEGKGLKAIANQLNHEGYKSKKGIHFQVNGIRDILHNPMYIGKIRFGKNSNSHIKGRGKDNNYIIAEGKHDPIISEDLWNKVQALYEEKSGKPPTTFHGSFPLTGLVRCPVCGAGMVAHRSKRKHKDGTYTVHRYYACGNWRNKGSSVCNANGIRADYVEDYVYNRINEVLLSPYILKDVVNNINKNNNSKIQPLQEELNQINKQLSSFNEKKKKCFALYEEDIIDKNLFKERLDSLKSEEEVLYKRKSSIETSLNTEVTASIQYEYVKNVLSNFRDNLKYSSPEQEKTFLHLMIDNIIITKDKKIENIVLKFDENIQELFSKPTPRESSDTEDSPLNTKEITNYYPSFMVRFTTINPKPPISLLQQNYSH